METTSVALLTFISLFCKFLLLILLLYSGLDVSYDLFQRFASTKGSSGGYIAMKQNFFCFRCCSYIGDVLYMKFKKKNGTKWIYVFVMLFIAFLAHRTYIHSLENWLQLLQGWAVNLGVEVQNRRLILTLCSESEEHKQCLSRKTENTFGRPIYFLIDEMVYEVIWHERS